MPDLSVDVAGVSFQNPIIVGASALCNRYEKIKRLAALGPGAITTKLISDFVPAQHKYAIKAVLDHQGIFLVGDFRVGLNDGISMIKQAKDLGLPIIANTAAANARDLDSWSKLAEALKSAGADIIELDMYPGGVTEPKGTTEVVKVVKEASNLPISLKLSVRDYDYIAVAKAGASAGANIIAGTNALNGFYPLHIEGFKSQYPGVLKQGLSSVYMGPGIYPIGYDFTLKVVKLVKLPVISGGGVMDWQNAVERIAIGGSLVSLVSAIYLKGLDVIPECVNGLKNYLEQSGIGSVKKLIGAGLTNFTNDNPTEAEEPLKPETIDYENTWPRKLTQDWWVS